MVHETYFLKRLTRRALTLFRFFLPWVTLNIHFLKIWCQELHWRIISLFAIFKYAFSFCPFRLIFLKIRFQDCPSQQSQLWEFWTFGNFEWPWDWRYQKADVKSLLSVYNLPTFDKGRNLTLLNLGIFDLETNFFKRLMSRAFFWSIICVLLVVLQIWAYFWVILA